MISVGAVIGGPECAYFDSVMTDFMRHCDTIGKNSGEPFVINLVFHLPGSIWKPDYVGVRTAKFSRVKKILMMQAAVEDEMIAVRSRDEIMDYILDVADEAISLAAEKLKRSGIDYAIEKDREFLELYRAKVLG